MERPALRKLRADIEAGRVDCVVVHRVDRFRRYLSAPDNEVPDRGAWRSRRLAVPCEGLRRARGRDRGIMA